MGGPQRTLRRRAPALAGCGVLSYSAAAEAPTVARAGHRQLWEGLLPTVECRR